MKVLSTLGTLAISMFADSWALNLKDQQAQLDEVVSRLEALEQ